MMRFEDLDNVNLELLKTLTAREKNGREVSRTEACEQLSLESGWTIEDYNREHELRNRGFERDLVILL